MFNPRIWNNREIAEVVLEAIRGYVKHQGLSTISYSEMAECIVADLAKLGLLEHQP